MSDRIYDVLLVSFSRHSHQASFVPAFKENPRIRIIGVADDENIENELSSLNRKWAAQLRVPYYEGIKTAIERPEVDIVSIGHEIERRAEIAIIAANAGKHLWIDKFIGANRAECQSVVDAVVTAGVKSIIPSYIYNDLVSQSSKLMETGRLGELIAMHIEILFGIGIPKPIPLESRKANFLEAGRWKFPDIKREILTVGAYAVALVQQFFEPITEIYGQGGAFFFPEHAAHGADDFGTISLVDKSGRIATISAGRNGVASHSAGGPNQAFFFGSHGTGRVDGKRPGIEAHLRNRIVNADFSVDGFDPMQWHSAPPTLLVGTGVEFTQVALEEFIQALDDNGTTRFTVLEAMSHMEILLASYDSIFRGEPISIPICDQGNQ